MVQIRSAAVAAGALVVAFGLGACSPGSSEPEADVAPAETQSAAPATSEPDADSEGAAKDDSTKVVPGSYVDYADYVKSPEKYEGSDVVLFFHASWCPTCHAAEESIESTGVSDGLTIVKVDYDSSQDLKQKYGVTLQHTFIQIGDDGELKAKFVGQTTVDDIAAQLA